MVVCGAVLLVVVIGGIGKLWNGKVFLLLLAGALLCLGGAFLEEHARKETAITSLAKNEAGGGSMQREVVAQVADEEIPLTLTIPERQYNKKEAQEILATEAAALPERIKGKNASFEKVAYDLALPEAGENELVLVEWYSSDPAAISWQGMIGSDVPETGVSVTLTATLTLQEEETLFRQEMRVYPKAADGGLQEEIEEETERKNQNPDTKEYALPSSVAGKKITWYAAPENTAAALAVLLLTAGLCFLLSARKREEEKKKKRMETLRREYPELVSRLLLMLYAGGTMRRTFFRLAAGYQKEKKEKKEKKKSCRKEAFEEVTAVCREMEAGTGEVQAYEHMAERCALPAYRTLCVLLIQNCRRGGAGIPQALEQEVMTAFAERKREARVAGETASLKLLLPLGLMLLIVFALLLVPAFLSL